MVSDPQDPPSVSPDPDDDYLIALAQREHVAGIVSGDPDLKVDGGPRVLTPSDVLRLLRLEPSDCQVLVLSLWNLHLRVSQAAREQGSPDLTAFMDIIHAAARKLGGDPEAPLFGFPDLPAVQVDIRSLSRGERSACAYALHLDRKVTGGLHEANEDDVERLTAAFTILDRYVAIERLISPG